MSATDLHQVARWDVAAVRSALAALDGVAGRLPGRRLRLEAVGSDLARGTVWSGAAATVAGAAVEELAAAAAAVAMGLEESLRSLGRLATEAATARELAERALALAAAADVPLDAAGRPAAPLPTAAATMAPDQAEELTARLRAGAAATACAEQALQHAGLAAAAADAAAGALRGLGVVDGAAPADLAGLALAAGLGVPVPVPGVPRGLSPGEVAAWWARLPPAAHDAVLAARPDLLGDLDGLPARVRDEANRLVLAQALEDPHAAGHDTAVAVAAQVVAQEWSGRTVQLYEFDPAADLVAVSLGDLDTAGAVGVLVPGMGTTVAGDLDEVLGRAAAVTDSARDAAPALAVATVAWLGYRAPGGWLQAASSGDARRGGAALDRALDGLAASRGSTGTGRPRTTVVAHSYGTVVAHEAAERPGRLAADAVVVLGSPGMGWDRARGLEAGEVYDAWSPADPISYLGWFGQDPQAAGYGATELPVAPGTPHSGYFDADGPTLAALGRVVAGREHR